MSARPSTVSAAPPRRGTPPPRAGSAKCWCLRGGGGDETSPQTARAWLEEAAARGDAGAVKPLAELLWRQADPAAEPWLRQLATDGDTESMARLAELLLGVPRVSGQLEP